MKDIQTEGFGVLFLMDNFQPSLRHHLPRRKTDLKCLYNDVPVNAIVPILAFFCPGKKKKKALQSSTYLKNAMKKSYVISLSTKTVFAISFQRCR